MTLPIVIIAAVAENGVIGHDNDMPWRLPSDLKRFKTLTMGRPIIMGRRTFESIGRPLPGRDNIVVTRNTDLALQGVRVAYSLDEAVALAESLARASGSGEVFVIGGGQLYAESIDRAERLHITEVHERPKGNARFPDIDRTIWRETSRKGPLQGDRDSAPISFVTYERADR